MLLSRRVPAVLSVVVALLLATACFPGAGGDSKDGKITFWTVLVLPEQIKHTQSVLDDFTAETGVEAEVVAIDPGDLNTAVTNAAAAGDLPDVLFHTVDLTQGWAGDGILDVKAADEVVESVGRDSFNPAALDLVDMGGRASAVPTDGWGQVIFYRKDLFEEAGLEPPTTFDTIDKAARTLDDQDTVGLLAGTSTSSPYTQQSFEHFALANGCNLIDDNGEIAFDTPQCIEVIERYTEWMTEFSAGGAQDELTTRAVYLSGGAAMMVWSPHLYDELNGLSTEISPSCPECEDNPRFLAENTGFVQRISGPDGEPVQFGQTLNLGISARTDTGPAKQLAEYLLTDGYSGLLGIAPEGQFPMRPGEADDPKRYIDAWKDLEVGDKGEPAPIGDLLGDDGVDSVADGADSFRRWGVSDGQGELVQALYGEFVVPKALQQVMEGTRTPEQAAEQVQQRAEELDLD